MKNKILICSNYAWTIYNFRLNLINSLSENDLYCLTKYDNYIEKINKYFKSTFNLYIDLNGTSFLKETVTVINMLFITSIIRPNIILTYTVKPNIYLGIICLFLGIKHIPILLV